MSSHSTPSPSCPNPWRRPSLGHDFHSQGMPWSFFTQRACPAPWAPSSVSPAFHRSILCCRKPLPPGIMVINLEAPGGCSSQGANSHCIVMLRDDGPGEMLDAGIFRGLLLFSSASQAVYEARASLFPQDSIRRKNKPLVKHAAPVTTHLPHEEG